MKVALSFPGCHRRGGVERVVLECANFLSQRGHETHVFASAWDLPSIDPAVRRHQIDGAVGPACLKMFSFAMACGKQMERSCATRDAFGAFGVQSPPGGVFWVTSVHKAWLEISRGYRGFAGRFRQRCNPFHPAVLAREAYVFGGRRYRKLIALTPQVQSDLMRLYGVPAEDIVIIPNGFSPSEFNVNRALADRTEIRKRLGLRERDRVVVFAANELDRKGFYPLLDAVLRLADPSIRVLAVGRLNRGACAPHVARLGLQDKVIFTGPSSNIAEFYAAGDLFALPTTYEAWGLVIVEAMACGVPVVTSRLAGAAVAVSEGQSGYLLDDPRDAEEIASKLKLVLDGAHREREWIAESVARYAWDRVLVDYERVLQECARRVAAA